MPDPRQGLFERIKAMLDAGVAVILPTELVRPMAATEPPRKVLWRLVAVSTVGASGAVAVVLAVIIGTGYLEAHHPVLETTPTYPRAGGVVNIVFTGASRFGGEGRLTARLQLFDATGETKLTTTTLSSSRFTRGYRGRVQLPPEVVYAVLAVEDTAGDQVEANYGRLWEVIVHDDEGRPRFEALRERVARHATTRPDVALETARSMVEYYSDRAESWRTLFALERLVEGPESVRELENRHRSHFARLERELEGARPGPEEVAAMTLYARGVGDRAARERWTDRLLREAPRIRLAVQLRLQELHGEHGNDPPRLLKEHEGLWTRVGPGRDIAASAFDLAHRIGDGPRALHWADRWAALDPAAKISAAVRVTTIPGARNEGMARIRQRLRSLESEVRRDARLPGMSIDDQRQEEQRARTRLLAALGEALIEVGQADAGADTLMLAANLTWDPDLYRTAARALLSQRDTLAAVPFLARIAVDPGTSPSERGDLARLVRSHLPPGRWDDEVRQAQSRLRDQTLSRARRTRLPRAIPVEDREGRAQDLRALLEGEVAVVSLWYCFCPQFTSHIQRHRDLVTELSTRSVPVFTILVGGMVPDLSEGIQDALESPLVLDPDRAALRAFGYAQAPAYFIVDAEGTVRFAYSVPDEIPRQAYVLRQLRGNATLAPE